MDLPFEYRGRRVWVQVRVEGRDARAIFDTGSDGTALDSGFAEKIGLAPEESVAGSTVAAEFEVPRAKAPSVELAGAPLRGEFVGILPLSSQMPGLDMILGFDLLRQTPFTVDYAARRILVGEAASGEGDEFADPRDMRPSLWLEILGKRIVAMLDTGSARGISIPLQWVKEVAPALLGENSRREVLGSEVRSVRVAAPEAILGGHATGEVEVEAVTSEAGSFSEQGASWANVGNGLLEMFTVRIDGSKRVVALKRAGAP